MQNEGSRDITYYKMKIAFKNKGHYSQLTTPSEIALYPYIHCIVSMKWESFIITWASRPHGFSLTVKSFGRSKYTSSDIFTIEYLVLSAAAAAATCITQHRFPAKIGTELCTTTTHTHTPFKASQPHTRSTGYSLIFLPIACWLIHVCLYVWYLLSNV